MNIAFEGADGSGKSIAAKSAYIINFFNLFVVFYDFRATNP